MRWLLLDEIVVIEKGVRAISRSRVPDRKISREVLILEMMAQTGGLLLGAEINFDGDVVFGKVEKAEFTPWLKPGEELEIEATSENLRPEGAWIDGKVSRGDATIAQARLLLTNAGKLVGQATESVTFHKAFMDHFGVRAKVKLNQGL